MTHEETTALVRRANASGFDSIADYAVALEAALKRADDRMVEIYELAGQDPRTWVANEAA